MPFPFRFNLSHMNLVVFLHWMHCFEGEGCVCAAFPIRTIWMNTFLDLIALTGTFRPTGTDEVMIVHYEHSDWFTEPGTFR